MVDFKVHTSSAGVCRVFFPGSQTGSLPLDHDPKLARAAVEELGLYFGGELCRFTVPVDLSFATDFQRDIYQALILVPFGQTVTYSKLSALAGHPKAVRAVGSACGKNPVPLIIPCHRVVGTNGLGGWSGPVGWKERLLGLESGFEQTRIF